MPSDKIDTWLRTAPYYSSFIDIGGIGENSGNERVTAAREVGCPRVVMADFEPFSHHLWTTFRRKMQEVGVTSIEEREGIDVRDPDLSAKLGTFDFVHSTGINYHLPDPVSGVYNLARITNRFLVTNTMILPDVVENEYGRIELGESRVMFLPAVTDQERRILRKHYSSKFGWEFNNHAPRIDDSDPKMPYVTDAGLSCYPYWWLFSEGSFRSLLSRLGFKILDEWRWENHMLALFCERERK
ncbi:MAG: hypothetical protein B7Z67_13945 [Acidiphilium sp. 21-60-14]|nr:MAG: hypothetical protein B7Z67_13945 [Acidiphilium sp. 21-60-14]